MGERQARHRKAEVDIVREAWEKVQAEIKVDGVLTTFLDKTLDSGGADICMAAFKLVHRVLHPDGYVRRAHKSENQNMKTYLDDDDGPWRQHNKAVAGHWDFMDAWKQKINSVHDMNALDDDYKKTKSEPSGTPRPAWRKYTKLDKQDVMNSYASIDHGVQIGVRSSELSYRIEVPVPRRQNGQAAPPRAPVNHPTYLQREHVTNFICQPRSYPDLAAGRGALPPLARRACTVKCVQYPERNIKRWQVKKTMNDEAIYRRFNLGNNINFNPENPDVVQNKNLQPYWTFGLDSGQINKLVEGIPKDRRELCKTMYTTLHNGYQWVGQGGKSDLVMEAVYISARTGIVHKRVIIAEVDGEDKTVYSASDESKHSVKLAYKLMTGSGIQQYIQPETYNIRSNFNKYLEFQLEKAMLSTTSVQIPTFQEVLDQLQPGVQQSDYTTLLKCINLVLHMYAAHVQVAFYILMKEMYDIDLNFLMEDTMNQEQRKRMQDSRYLDHHFFINFTGDNIPDSLCFESKIAEDVKTWLKEKFMFQKRTSIKIYDTNDALHPEKWVVAPVVLADSPRSAMRTWKAKISNRLFPEIPGSKLFAIPISITSIQRVNMSDLCMVIKRAADRAYTAFCEGQNIQARRTRVDDRHAENLPLLAQQAQPAEVTINRRDFPDRCFLTRKEQFNKAAIWNTATAGPLEPDRNLCNAGTNVDDELTTFYFGYENPLLGDRHNYALPRHEWDINQQWDQVDVRMHYFHYALQEEDWKTHAHGVWYLPDYIEFLQMLRNLSLPSDATPDCHNFTIHPTVLGPHTWQSVYEAVVSKDYRLWKDNTIVPALIWPARPPTQAALANLLSNYLAGINNSYNTHSQRQHSGMPHQSEKVKKAYHIFSILSYFFDSRDGGACLFRWEDWLLAYFGDDDEAATESEFHKFSFTQEPLTNIIQYVYFDQTWFHILRFIEQNFRNAVTPIHYKIYDMRRGREWKLLQESVKKLHERQTSLLNNRASFVGMRNVSPHLSFLKYRPGYVENLPLRQRILSAMDDELPMLDPALVQYVRKFRIPDAELFLRIIRCPNLLALRDLAIQHLSPQPQEHMRTVLQYFAPAVQSEIEVMLKFVETDQSVFAMTPLPHPSKAFVVQETYLSQCMRILVQADVSPPYFATPLAWKFHMFLLPNVFPVFRQFFCTQKILNAGCKRALKFILIQVKMLYYILTRGITDRSNELLEYYASNALNDINPHEHYECNSLSTKNIPLSIGSSLLTWPKRDMNVVCEKRANNNGVLNDRALYGLVLVANDNNAEGRKEIEVAEVQDEMTEHETNQWILLTYARPHGQHHNFASLGFKICSEKSEASCMNITCHHTKTEDGKLEGVWIHEQEDSYVYYERGDRENDTTASQFKEFPSCIQCIIPHIPDRKFIYIPAPCFYAWKSWEEDSPPSPKQKFRHEGHIWSPITVRSVDWCWKRLLVKIMFLHMLGRVTTRAEQMTALYYPLTRNGNNEEMPDADQELVFRRSVAETAQDVLDFGTDTVRYGKVVQHMHTLNEHVFGHLATKMNVLTQNMRAKRTQLILTIHPYRQNVIMLNTDRGEEPIHLHECVYPVELRWHQERQLLWCQHLRNLNIPGSSYRYLRLDARLGNRHSREAVSLTDITNLQFYTHGPHIYLRKPLTHKYIMYNGTTYAWMGSEYVILRHNNRALIGTTVTQETNAVQLFLTCFDTRTYSSFRIHNVDSENMSNEIYAMDASDLREQGVEMNDTRPLARMDEWRSTGDDSRSCKWVYHNGAEHATHVKSTRGGARQNIESEYMLNIQTDDVNLRGYLSRFYPLPDVLKNYNIGENELQGAPLSKTVPSSSEAVNSTFRTQIANARGDPYQKVRAWNVLHGDNKEVEVDEPPDANQRIILNSSIENIENETVRDMIREIEEVLRSRSSEDMQ